MTPSVETLLPEPVLAAKLCLVLAVAAFSAVVVLQTPRALATKYSVADALAALSATRWSGGCHVLTQWNCLGGCLAGRCHRRGWSGHQTDGGAGVRGCCSDTGGQQATDLLADVRGRRQCDCHAICRRTGALLRWAVHQLVVGVFRRASASPVFA